jgi:glycosyltransferase involved in cell wall biosynthesis
VRVLVISNLYPPIVKGGYELECAAVAGRLRQSHEVTVLTSGLQGQLASRGESGVRRELPFLNHTLRHSLCAPASAVHAARTMRRTLAETNPELIFVWNGAQLPHAAVGIALDSGRPVAFRVCEPWFGRLFSVDQFTRHLLPGDTGMRAVWAAGMRAVNRWPALRLDPGRPVPAAISWNSHAVRESAGVPRAVEPVLERVLHPTSPHASAFSAVQRVPSRDRVEIAFVGRVDEAKGVDVAIRAMRTLRERHGIDAVLRLAGPCDHRAGPRIDTYGADVELLGWRSPREVAALLATAHALVVPSRVPESFGLVCIEGALARVPIVASRIGGIPECLHDEEHALLVPPGDADALAAALARLLTQRDETTERVARARARAEELSLPRYLAASEEFVEDAVAALRHRRKRGHPHDARRAKPLAGVVTEAHRGCPQAPPRASLRTRPPLSGNGGAGP